jgi:hypothetical protein
MALPLPPTSISNGAFETTKENAECERAGCESSPSLLLLLLLWGEVVSRDGIIWMMTILTMMTMATMTAVAVALVVAVVAARAA